jgi:acetyl-CoA carboxylase carboxyl transferase subunit beta
MANGVDEGFNNAVLIDMATTSFNKKTLGLEVAEPAVTPPSPDSPTTSFVKKPKLAGAKSRKRDIPEGLWTKCEKCGNMIYDKELDANLKVCLKCQHHFPIGARERINALVETCSFEEMDASMESIDVLQFTSLTSYAAKLKQYASDSNLKDAVCTGIGRIGKYRVALGVMDFSFMGGSMGSVVGEKLTRLIESATDKGLPLIIISTSGGARMQEGVFSLLQMAKTCGALAYHARNKLPYVSVLTNPTTGGVTASFATVGDLILAEPGAMIGFAGRRVIESTTQTELPPDFQTAEFLLEHGLIDAIVSRNEMKTRLCAYLDYLMEGREQQASLGK